MTRPLAILTLLCAALAAPLSAQDLRPLPLGDYETVYQRVLTRAGATPQDEAGGDTGAAYPPFTPLYVFAREGGRVQVGPSATRAPDAWLPEDVTVPWTQNVVVAFTNPAGRSRQMIFETEDALVRFMNHEALAEFEPVLLAEADDGAPRAEAQVVSVEPVEHIDIQEQFYLMPILEFREELHPLNYDSNLHLRIASLPLDEAQEDTTDAEDFEVGVVFVIDTTSSMDPYIQGTREALERLVGFIGSSDIGSRVHFGAVAFRDNPDAAPGLDYRTNEIIELSRRESADEVVSAIRGTAQATASSRGFNEDSLSGVQVALDMDWDQSGKPFAGRYIVVVTDAGPKPASSEDSGTGLDPAELQGLAEEDNIAILTLHLRTQSGAATHAYAEGAYRTLSRFGEETFYYPIEDGDLAAFRAETERLASQLVLHVSDALGRARPVNAPEGSEAERILGNAMLLAFLGSDGSAVAPDLIEGWVSSQAVSDPLRTALEPRLLLTRNEMATLADLVGEFYELGNEIESTEDAETFFDQLQAAILRMSQDPDRVVRGSGATPEEALEFLADLPYRSDILNLDIDRWIESVTARRGIIDALRPKLRLYRSLLGDPDKWTATYEGAPDGEMVYAMPLRFLP